MIENNILACFLMSDYAKTYLTRTNPLWFTDWHVSLVKTMQDMYIDNQPIGIHTLYQVHKDRAIELAKLTNFFVTDKSIEKELFYQKCYYYLPRLFSKMLLFRKNCIIKIVIIYQECYQKCYVIAF